MEKRTFRAVFFDLDGTLLPMGQQEFVDNYFSRLCRRFATNGVEPGALTKAVWKGTAAMVKNDGAALNRERFWDT